MRKNFNEVKTGASKIPLSGGQNFDCKGNEQKNSFYFDENFDNHFNLRKGELKDEIYTKMLKKQRAGEMNAKTSVTTAYKDVDKTIA